MKYERAKTFAVAGQIWEEKYSETTWKVEEVPNEEFEEVEFFNVEEGLSIHKMFTPLTIGFMDFNLKEDE